MKDFKFRMNFLELDSFLENGLKDGSFYSITSRFPFTKLSYKEFCKLMYINKIAIGSWVKDIENGVDDKSEGLLEIENLPNTFSFASNSGEYKITYPSGEKSSNKEDVIKELSKVVSQINVLLGESIN